MYGNSLKQILVDRIEIVKKLQIVERDYILEDSFPYVMTGIRRSGKSYMLYQIMNNLIAQGHSWEDFLYINFEDERLMGFSQENFNDIFEAYYSIRNREPILFLDEIQNVPGWEKFARRIADEKRLAYITGSNASLFSKEIEATLGGRYLSKQIHPYNFQEFLKAKNHPWDQTHLYSTREQGQLLQEFTEYMTFGGFPEIPNLIQKRDYLSSLYSKIFLGDVIARNKISNTIALEILVKKIAESIRQPQSYTRLANIVASVGVKVSKSTIIQYIEHLKDSYLIFNLENYSQKLVERATNPKYYFIDSGLVNLFLLDADPALLENLVGTTLLRKYGRDQIYFYQDSNSELDFYIPDESLAIQVSYSLVKDSTRAREIESIINFNKFEQTKKNIILTYNEEEIIKQDGIEIEVIPVYKWLLATG